LPEQSVFHDSWLFCYPDVYAVFKEVKRVSVHLSGVDLFLTLLFGPF
jgi:hypothetical protein